MAVIRKDGTAVWTETRATLLFDSNGVPSGVLGVTRDISERRKAQESLRLSEEKNRLLMDRYRVLVQNAAEGIAVVQDGKIAFVNPGLLRMVSYSEEELFSTAFDTFVHPDDREMVLDRYARRLQGEQVPSTYPFRVVDKDGGIKWAEINSVTFEWEGRPAILALLSDITERKRSQEALQASEERFRKIYEKSPVGIVVYDSEGKVTGMNKAALEIFGLAQTGESKNYALLEEPLLPKDAIRRLRAGKSLSWEGTFNFDDARSNSLYGKMRRTLRWLPHASPGHNRTQEHGTCTERE